MNPCGRGPGCWGATSPVSVRSTTSPEATGRQPWPKAKRAEKIVQVVLAAVLAGVLGLGMVLKASPTGSGTHTVLGLPPCGTLMTTGRPCPTCGATTSFVLAAHGQFYEALANQPLGFMAFVAAVGGLSLVVGMLITGKSGRPLLTRQRVTILVVIFLVAALASWFYKLAPL